MRILFVNHTGSRSGAENAMTRLLTGLPPEHQRAVACPPQGGLALELDELGVRRFELTGTDASFALDPVQTPLALADLLRSALEVRRISRRFAADVIHANSLRAGLIAVLARALGGARVLVQSHDQVPPSITGRLIRNVIAWGADVVVAVSGHTAASFNHGLRRPLADVVWISVDHSRFHPGPQEQSAKVRSGLGFAASTPLILHTAQITPWKGQDTAIRALATIRREIGAHLLIVGEVAFSSRRYDNVEYRRSLARLVDELELGPAVHFLGQRSDIPELMAASDLLMLPSWDEPFGLVAAEAMAVGTPVLVTARGGLSEYVTDGVNGRLLDPLDVESWAVAAVDLFDEPETRARMGEANIRAASYFNDARYCADMLKAYARTVA